MQDIRDYITEKPQVILLKEKKLRYREDILDNMGSEELAANLFRITQTESKLKKENKKIIDQIYKIKD